jgi:response regulator RpfG family c-di-GMP phosphodiesterase
MKEKILVVDDDPQVTGLLAVVLVQNGYECLPVNSPNDALEALRQNQGNSICLALVDIVLPGMSGLDLMEKIHREHPRVGTVAISGENNMKLGVDAMRKGALDFITKPFQIEFILPRIQKAIDRVRLERDNHEYQIYLEEKVENRTNALLEKHRTLQKLYINTVEAIVRAIEAKDAYTVGHSKRVSKYCRRIAIKLGIDSDNLQDMEIAGLLHDVGKIGISDTILGKPSKLTIEEYETIKEHPMISLKIIEPIHEFKKVKEYVKYHHEKYDGTGYPDGLKGEDIPLGARILSVADAFDTMWIGRHYHASWDLETVVKEFQKNRGTQFDPKVVDIFVELLREDGEHFDSIRKENPPRFKEKSGT